MGRKLRRYAEKKSKMMREYFNSHYEDPAYLIINRNPKLKEMLHNKSVLEESFTIALKHADPLLYARFDEIIGMYLSAEVFMLEEAYILGVQDRDRAFMQQI